jgi:hypothetical protein
MYTLNSNQLRLFCAGATNNYEPLDVDSDTLSLSTDDTKSLSSQRTIDIHEHGELFSDLIQLSRVTPRALQINDSARQPQKLGLNLMTRGSGLHDDVAFDNKDELDRAVMFRLYRGSLDVDLPVAHEAYDYDDSEGESQSAGDAARAGRWDGVVDDDELLASLDDLDHSSSSSTWDDDKTEAPFSRYQSWEHVWRFKDARLRTLAGSSTSPLPRDPQQDGLGPTPIVSCLRLRSSNRSGHLTRLHVRALHIEFHYHIIPVLPRAVYPHRRHVP